MRSDSCDTLRAIYDTFHYDSIAVSNTLTDPTR